MGGGASKRDGYWDDDVPIVKADLHTDGKVASRLNTQDMRDQMSYSNDFGRIQSKYSDPAALRAQAAAHWHRVISHARDARQKAMENGEPVPCPLCGQMTDDPLFCGFCGDIDEVTQKKIEEEKIQEEQASQQSQSLTRKFSSFLLGRGSGSKNGSPSSRDGLQISTNVSSPSNGSADDSDSPIQKVLWNSDSQSYERIELSPSRRSPSVLGGSKRSSPNSSFYLNDKRGSALINVDDEKEHVNDIVGTLLDASVRDREQRGRKSSVMLKARLNELKSVEAERAKGLERLAQLSPQSRQKKKFMGLGLDSSSDSDDSTDGSPGSSDVKKLRKRLSKLQRESNGDDLDAEYEDGESTWERSPFFRLLNASTINNSAPRQLRQVLDKMGEDTHGVDVREIGEPPEPPLPPCSIVLKGRTGSSIEIAWDIEFDMLQMLEAVQQVYGKGKQPLYQAQYRLHAPGAGGPHSSQGGSKYGPSSLDANGLPLSGPKDDKRWKVGCLQTYNKGCVIHGLVANTSYQFRVRRLGWDKWNSAPPVVIRSGPGVPSAPRQVAAKEVSSDSILLAWSPPEKDNGLPIAEYHVYIKSYQGEFTEAYRGRERCCLCSALSPNMVHIFQVQAANRLGKGEISNRTAVRTLASGAQPLSSWVEVIDERANKMFYIHSKTNAVSLTLPQGAPLDEDASFKNKRKYLQTEMERKMMRACEAYNVTQRVLQVSVQRENLLEASLRILLHTPTEEIDAGPIRVRYHGEEGMDAGGLAKDWFVEIAKRLHDDSTGLLVVNEETGYVTIDPRAASIHSQAESHRLFTAVGTFLSKSLIDGQTLGLNLDPVLLCLLAGRKPNFNQSIQERPDEGQVDLVRAPPSSPRSNRMNMEERYRSIMNGKPVLELAEPQFYRGLQWVRDNDVTHMDLTFTCSYELFDESQVVELLPYGTSKDVTEDNKAEYIALLDNWLCKERFEPALSSLLTGFTNHINVHRHLRHFTLNEIQLLIGGQPDIDVATIMRDCTYGGCTSDNVVVKWLVLILEEYNLDELGAFLGYVTGCPHLPVDGLDPPLHITLMEDGGDSTLPRAHTCFNQVVVPAYSDIDVMKERLTYALQNAYEGFHIS